MRSTKTKLPTNFSNLFSCTGVGHVRKLHFQQMRERSKRQSHGATNNGFDRFPGPDHSFYDPLSTPSFTQAQQQLPPPTLNQKPLSLADMVDLTNPSEPDTPIDYLTPPSSTFQNFPPVQNNGPFTTTPNNVNSVQPPFQNSFPPPQQAAFSNINPTVSSVNSLPLSITNPTSGPGFSDQNSNFVTPATNFVTPQSREISNNFGNFVPNEHQVSSNTAQIGASPSQGKWDLGFDASEILNPPLYDAVPSPGPGVGDYETLTLNSFSRRPVPPSPITSSASSNTPVLALNPAHSQFTIHGSLRANEHGQSIIWGTFKPAPFTNVPAAASNDHLRFSSPPQQPVQENYTPFSDSYLPQGTATDSFIPHPDETFSSSFRRRQSQSDNDDDDEDSDDETNDHKPRPAQVKGPVYSFVKTFKNGSFKWGVRQGAFNKR